MGGSGSTCWSPDFDPIEHIWRYLKNILHQRFSDASAPGGPAVKMRIDEYLERYYS